MTEINAADAPFGSEDIMRGTIRVDLEALAELREAAARVCEETKSLIEQRRRLREWASWLSTQANAADPVALTVCCDAWTLSGVSAHPLTPETRPR